MSDLADLEWLWLLLLWLLVGLCFAAGWGLHAVMSANDPPDAGDSGMGS